MKKNYAYYAALLIGIFAYAGLKDFFQTQQGCNSAEAMWYSMGIILGVCVVVFVLSLFLTKRRWNKKLKELEEKKNRK